MWKLGIEITLVAIAIVLSILEQLEWYDSAILSMLSFIVVEIVAQKFKHDSSFAGIHSSISDVNYELKDIANNVQLKNAHDDLKSNIDRISHPYFIALLSHRLEQFVQDNSELFDENHATEPYRADTFGAEGLSKTRNNLKCVSTFDDYWSDRGNSDYYNHQLELIKKGVKIKRLFVLTDSNRDIAEKQIKKQKADGIDVRSIDKSLFGDSKFFRDYLIQDNTLLVDLIPNSKKKPKHSESSEIITTNGVGARIDEFNKYWGHAKRV